MWPEHCVQGSYGAKYHKDLIIKSTDYEISKGVHSKVDALSAFGSDKENTGLFNILEKN